MKPIFKIFLIVTITLIINGCVDENVIEVNKTLNGSIYLTSEPSGAKIILLGTDINKVTPDSITNLESGLYEVTLQKKNFYDTSFAVKVFKNLRTTKNIKLKKIITSGKIYISSSPPQAEIFLNNITTNKFTPDSLTNLTPGYYNIKLSKSNFTDTSFVVHLLKNSTIKKNIQLKPQETKGNIFIMSDPIGALIKLEQKNTHKITPDTLKNLKTGNYQITLALKDFSDTTFIANVVKNYTSKYKIDLKDTTKNVTVKTEYRYMYLTGKLNFFFKFNQEISLDYIDLLEPDSTIAKRYLFNNEHYSAKYPAEISYPQKRKGKWIFIINGEKIVGRKNKFKINTNITVQ